MAQPIWLNVGRVAVEKNIATFLETPLPGTKVMVGEGPQLEALKEKHKDAHFLGVKQGDELAACFANADVFCFPASPTRSASSCSKPWRRARPSPASTCPARAT